MRTALKLLAAASLAAAIPAQAATEFEDSIPVELVRIFLGIEAGDGGGLYRDVPADFPLDSMPADFSVLGSVERGGIASVYLSAPGLEAAPASEAVAQALTAQGWLRIPDPLEAMGNPRQGFQDPRPAPERPLQLCREAGDSLNLTGMATPSGSVVALRQFPIQIYPQQSCRERVETSAAFVAGRLGRPGNPLEAQMPRLLLPAEADFGGRPPGRTGGLGGSGDELEARTPLAIDWEPQRLLEHFASQLEAQGWAADGEWNTGAVAGASWTRQAEGDAALLGILSLVRKDTAAYQLEFRLMNR